MTAHRKLHEVIKMWQGTACWIVMNRSCEKTFTLPGISRSSNIQLLSHCKTILEHRLLPPPSDIGQTRPRQGTRTEKTVLLTGTTTNAHALHVRQQQTKKKNNKTSGNAGGEGAACMHARRATYKSIPSLLSHVECSDNLYWYRFQASPKDVVT